MTDAQARVIVDKLCEEASWLLYGQSYASLSPISQSNVVAEVVLKFDPKHVDYADSLGKR